MTLNTKRKGFTLVELIVVMAIFAILMAAVMQIITPLNRIAKRASLQEANASAVDNVKTYLENSIRYSDCIETFVGGLTDNEGKLFKSYTDTERNKAFGIDAYDKTTPKAISAEEAAVINFLDNHYTNRAKPGTETAEQLPGVVRMLKIDNNKGGVITEYEWNFKAGYTYDKFLDDKTTELGRVNAYLDSEHVRVEDSVINPVYYENYAFYIAPGYNELVTYEGAVTDISSDVPNNAEDYCAMVKPAVKVTTDSDGNEIKTQYNDEARYFNRNMFSLSVITYKNDGVSSESGFNYDYSGTGVDENGNKRIVFHSPFAITNTNENYGPVRYMGTKVEGGSNYNPLTKVEGSNGKWEYRQIKSADAPMIANKLYAHEAVTGDDNDGCIYFIYTLPEFK